MRVKYVGGGMLPLVGTDVVTARDYCIVHNTKRLEEMVDLGYEFLIKEDDKEIPAKEYFNPSKAEAVEKVTEKAEIEVIEDEEEDVEEEERTNQCQATTASGNQCENEAKYPEEDPQYCGIHKSKLN